MKNQGSSFSQWQVHPSLVNLTEPQGHSRAWARAWWLVQWLDRWDYSVLLLDRQCQLFWQNQAAHHEFGEILLPTDATPYPWQDLVGCAQQLQQSSQSETQCTVSLNTVHGKRSYRLILQKFILEADTAGTLVWCHPRHQDTSAMAADVAIAQEVQEQAQQLETIIQTSAHGLLVVSRSGRVLFVNPATEQLFGRSAHEMVGYDLGIPMVQQDYTEIELPQRDGAIKTVQMRVVPIQWNGHSAHLVSLADITTLRSAQKQLQILSLASEQSPASIVITNAEGQIEYVNPKFEELTGYTAEEVHGLNPRILRSGYTSPDEYRTLWETITSGHEWHGEFHNRKKNGDLYWERASISPITDEYGQITHFLATKEDITQQREQEELLRYRAYYDHLTGLPNRALGMERLRQALEWLPQSPDPVALLYLDLDLFKSVNDSLGHAMGDRLLMLLSRRLQGLLGKNDTLARLGGDEFLFVIPRVKDTPSLIRLVEGLLALFKEPFTLDEEEVVVSASIGVTQAPLDGETADILLRNADTAMYVAKNAGRNQYCCFTPQLNDLNQRRAHLQRYLRHAAEYHELSLVYQPFVSLQTGKIVGAEALLRWHHPRLGTIAPDEFIPLAEETGLIVPLGQWVIHQACQDAQTWREQGFDCWVSVNVSPKQFCSPQIPLLNVIDQALAESGLPEQNLELEITERLMIQDLPNTKTTLDHLRDRQIRLSMDDFGTGYSSLSILRHLPLTLIKIDRSFTMDLPNDPETAILVQTILTMAHNFKFGVIAEGIETPEQRQFLQDFHCDYGQGYLFAKPLPQTEFLAFLRDQKR